MEVEHNRVIKSTSSNKLSRSDLTTVHFVRGRNILVKGNFAERLAYQRLPL